MGDIAVQKATCTFTSTGTTADATLPTSVDMNYTFLLVPQGFTGAGHGSFTGNQEDTLVHVQLLNATTVRATRAVGGTTPSNAASIEVWVVEDTSPGAWFQVLGRGVRAGSTSTATHNESHTAASSTDNIVALVHGGCHDTRADYASWRPARNTTSSTTFTRGNTASGSYEYSWEVIEFVESGWTVKEHVLVDNGGADAEDPHTISTLSDLSKAALIRGGVESDGFQRAPDEIYVGHYPDTVTNVDTITDEGTWQSTGVTITCYSIHHADLSVQRNASFNGGSMSNFSGTSVNDTITAVTAIAECALVVSQSGNGTGYTDYAEDVIWGDITTTTNVQLQRANSNDGSVDVAYEVIDFSGLTSDFARTAYGAINLSGWASGGAGADEHTATVEIAFSHSTKTAAPGESDWTDVTADVLESPKIKITRGGDRAMQKVNPGRLEFTLNNTSRDYERGYNGTYGTDGFKPGRPVRVFVDYRPTGKFNTRRYMRFVGFIRSGKPSYERSGNLPIVRVMAIDQFAILARTPAPTDAPTEIGVGTPFAYYKLLETSGTTATDDGSGANNGTYGGSYTLANLAWSAVDTTRKHVQFDGADADGVSATLTGVTSTGAMTMLAWVRPTAVDATNVLWDHTVAELGPTGSNNSMSFTLSVRPDGTLHYRHGALKQALSDPNVDTDLSTLNEWHMIAVTRSATGEVRGYIDGSLTSVGAQDVSGEPIPSNTALGIGLGQHSAAGASSMGYDGHIGDVAIYTDELSAGRIAAIYAGQVTARPAEDAGARIDAILNGVDIPAAWREVDQGDSTLQTVTLDETVNTLALIQRAAESEHGRVYVDRFGRVRFESRWHRSHRDVSATFGDYFANDEYPMASLVVDDNEERLINRARVTRAGGEEQVATNTASLAEHGEFEYAASTDLDMTDDTEALTLAEVLVNEQADPDRVITDLSVSPRRSPGDLYPVVLESDISTRFLIQYRPDGVQPGTPLEQDSFVEGLTEVIGAKDYRVSYRLSPLSTSGFWRLGFSQLGVDTRLGY